MVENTDIRTLLDPPLDRSAILFSSEQDLKRVRQNVC